MSRCRVCHKEIDPGRIICSDHECSKAFHYQWRNWSVKRYVTLTIGRYSAEFVD